MEQLFHKTMGISPRNYKIKKQYKPGFTPDLYRFYFLLSYNYYLNVPC